MRGFQLFALLLHQLGRGLRQEARIVQLALRAGDFALQVLAFLFQARKLLLQIHQIAQRDADLARGTYGADHLFACQRILAADGHVAGVSQALQIGLCNRERALPARIGDERHMRAPAGLHIHLGAQVADSADDLHQPFHLAFFGFKGVFRLDFGPAGQNEHAVMLRQVLVHLLGQEGHEGMQELEKPLQHVEQHAANVALLLLVLAHQAALGQFDVPVAELAPREVVDLVGGHAEVAVLHVGAHLGHGLVQPGKNPLVRQLQKRRVDGFAGLRVHQHKARGVPHLVGEVAGAFHLLVGVAGVVAGADAHGQREAQRVGPILVDDLQRVHAVSEALGHLAALCIAHQAMDEHGIKRAVAHLFDAGEDHARHPEEDDVIAGHQHAGGIEVFEVLGLIRPAQRGEGPQRRGEPGVQHVLVLMKMRAAALGAGRGRLARHDGFAAFVAVPRGDAVAPPQLTADAPVADVLHPVVIGLGKALRHKLRPARTHHLDGGLGQRLHLDEPLGAGHGINGVMAAVAGAHVVGVVLNLDQIALLLKLLHHRLAAFQRGHALEAPGVLVHGAVVVGHADDLQVVPLAYLKVVGVVGGGHLHRAGAELHVHIAVGHHGNFLVEDGQNHLFAHQVRIARVIGVDRHAGIAQHGFGARGGHHHALAAVRAGIADVPQMAGLLLILHLGIGKRGLALRAPVDDAVAAVDEALFVELDKHLAHGAVAALVHGEALAAPVAAGAQAALLAVDAAAILLLPRPGALQEAVAAQHLLGQALLGHLLHHLDLGGDGGVVRAGQPEGGVTLHAVIADGRILQEAVHRVAHMQLAGDVGRGHDDGEGLFAFHPVRHKRAALLPHLVELIFNGLGVVHLFHFKIHGVSSLPDPAHRPGNTSSKISAPRSASTSPAILTGSTARSPRSWSTNLHSRVACTHSTAPTSSSVMPGTLSRESTFSQSTAIASFPGKPETKKAALVQRTEQLRGTTLLRGPMGRLNAL